MESRNKNSREIQNQSSMVVQGHLTQEAAELQTFKVPKDKSTVRYGLTIPGKQQLIGKGLPCARH